MRVILTENAKRFVTPLTFEGLTGNLTHTSMWTAEANSPTQMNHIDLARWADLIVVAPATANCISELAQGAATQLLTTEILAAHCPIVIAPAMNPTMYSSRPVQENIRRLKGYGYLVLDAETGLTACGDEGAGRMIEPVDLFEQLATHFCEPSNGKSVLITLGPTRSYLDPVRYFTNRSSGKMGTALAFAAVKQGFHVHVIAGPTQVPLPRLARITRVVTTDQMAGSVFDAFNDCDYFVSTAAVLDMEFETTFDKKLKKSGKNSDTLKSKIQFIDTVDILKSVGELKKSHQRILGFAAETDQHLQFAQNKLLTKNCDAIFVNPVEQDGVGFEATDNAGHFVFLKSKRSKKAIFDQVTFRTMSKPNLAHEILTHFTGSTLGNFSSN
jgi:phosphopantothenoylcysteine decarboxylase/phosphopantothenate--cysteine ligase